MAKKALKADGFLLQGFSSVKRQMTFVLVQFENYAEGVGQFQPMVGTTMGSKTSRSINAESVGEPERDLANAFSVDTPWGF
jgi:hypothetical protein